MIRLRSLPCANPAVLLDIVFVSCAFAKLCIVARRGSASPDSICMGGLFQREKGSDGGNVLQLTNEANRELQFFHLAEMG